MSELGGHVSVEHVRRLRDVIVHADEDHVVGLHRRPLGQPSRYARPATSESSSPPPASSPFELSTDLQIDNQHQVYYEFVDKDTGAVVFEIPPEALRAIAESLNIPLEGQSDYHNLDVSS